MHLVWPLNLSTAAVAEFVIEEDFPFTILAEEPSLLLKFLCHGDTVGPHLGGNLEGSDMLLYAVVSSKSCGLRWLLSQYHSKTPIEDSLIGSSENPNKLGHVNLYCVVSGRAVRERLIGGWILKLPRSVRCAHYDCLGSAGGRRPHVSPQNPGVR